MSKHYKYYKILILFSLILLTVLTTSCSNNGRVNPCVSFTVSGTITDIKTEEAVSGACVSLADSVVYTNEEGFYTFLNIQEGTYEFSVQADNYFTLPEKIDIYGDTVHNKQLYCFDDGGIVTGQVNLFNTSQDYSGYTVSTSSNDSLDSDNNRKKYVENEILVKYKDGGERLNIQSNNNKFSLLSTINTGSKGKIHHLLLRDGTDLETVISELNSSAEVEWAQPNYLYYPSSIPNDFYYPNQWGNHRTNLEAARDFMTANNSVKVAVIDTGILPDHPDLTANINMEEGADFYGPADPELPYNMTDDDPTDEEAYLTDLSHGTHVSGIIGAVSDNEQGVSGIYNVEILPIKIFGSGGGNTFDLVEGLEYAVAMNADIINMSLAGDSCNDFAVQEVIQDAVAQGIIVVAAAGNNSNSNVMYPAAFPEVIAVASIDYNSELSSFSSYGEKLDLVAPGGSILSTSGYNYTSSTYHDYYYMSGTSMATPFVSGIAALLKAEGIGDIRNTLTNTAVDLGDEGKDNIYGWGLVDAYAALRGEKLPSPVIFAATIQGNDIYAVSEIVNIDSNNQYTIPGVPPGEYYIATLRDVNENSILDIGDYFGISSEKIPITTDNVSSADLDLFYLDENSAYINYQLNK